jgi:hypothetical protein
MLQIPQALWDGDCWRVPLEKERRLGTVIRQIESGLAWVEPDPVHCPKRPSETILVRFIIRNGVVRFSATLDGTTFENGSEPAIAGDLAEAGYGSRAIYFGNLLRLDAAASAILPAGFALPYPEELAEQTCQAFADLGGQSFRVWRWDECNYGKQFSGTRFCSFDNVATSLVAEACRKGKARPCGEQWDNLVQQCPMLQEVAERWLALRDIPSLNTLRVVAAMTAAAPATV